MPDLPISGLPPGIPPTPADLLAIVQAGLTNKVRADDLEGPLLPGWDAVVASLGPAAAPQIRTAAFVHGHWDDPDPMASITLAGLTAGQIVIVWTRAFVRCLADSPALQLIVTIVTGAISNAAAVVALRNMVAGEVETLVAIGRYVMPADGDLLIEVEHQIFGPDGSDLSTLGFAGATLLGSGLWALALPMVLAGGVQVVRDSGPLAAGGGADWIVTGSGDYLIW